MKKVLFVNLRLTAGGSERVMTTLAGAFAEHSIDTEMLLLKEDVKTYDVNPNVKVTECYCPMRSSKIIWHIKRIKSIRQAIKNSGADTVISFMWDINMNVILACFGLNKRVIVSERADPNNESRRRQFRFASKWILPRANVTVFQTPQVKNMYPKQIQKKSVVIPNPIPDTLPAPFLGERRKVIVAAGRFTNQKNFDMLIRAFAIFSRVRPDYRLYIYGEGNLRNELEKCIRELEIEDKVFMPGYVNNVNDVMRDAMIYASSSNYEGISNSMLEALAMGIPSVCTDCPVGGAAMVIKNGVNGVLVPVGGVSEMASAFLEIASSDEYAKLLSQNGTKIINEYSLSYIFERWRSICR